MDYIELTARVPATQASAAADIIAMVSGQGASIEAPFTQADLESDAVPRQDGYAFVRVYLRETDGVIVAKADAALADAGIGAQLSERVVADEDWAESWKAHFGVERYGERIVVVPSWLSYDSQPDDVVITLDPGMAFGTGQHETTRMCLEALERAITPGMQVLDAGCGSGILSLAAAGLGATRVAALDTDPDCVRITADNARLNGTAAIIEAATGALGAAWPFVGPAANAFDVAVANIVASVIVQGAKALVVALKPGGALIVSGVIGSREDDVRAALTAAGASVHRTRAMGDWRCIEAVRA